MYFPYGEREIQYLRRKDKKLAAIIDQVGHIHRQIDHDLFSSVVHHIIGQQISTKAQATIWRRVQEQLGSVDAEALVNTPPEVLQGCGMTFRKANYILDFAQRVQDGAFDLDGLWQKSDTEAITALSSLKGIGVWTAEMILLFCMERPDIFSFNDLAIQRGLRMVYRHTTIDRQRFERYRRRFSPCCSVASLYLWAVAGGAVEGLRDPAARKEK